MEVYYGSFLPLGVKYVRTTGNSFLNVLAKKVSIAAEVVADLSFFLCSKFQTCNMHLYIIQPTMGYWEFAPA